MSTVHDALAALAARIETAITDVDAPVVYVHDGDALHVDFAQLPAVIVSKAAGARNQWAAASYGVGEDAFTAHIVVLVHAFTDGNPVAFESEDFAPILLKTRDWTKALSDCLYGDVTLGGTAVYIGHEEEGVLFDYIEDYLHWQNVLCYGFLFELRIVQQHAQTMTA